MSKPAAGNESTLTTAATTQVAAPPQGANGQPIVERRSGVDRRDVLDRRNQANGTGLERRRGPGRRRTDFVRSAEEGQMTPEQFLFVAAIDAYKRVNQVPYPTWTQVLEVIRKLGYRKTAASTLNLSNAEDWTEAPDTPAFIVPVEDSNTLPGSRALQPDERDD